MYHGTRCPAEVLRSEGLRFDIEALEKLARKAAKIIGVNYGAWASCGKELGMIGMIMMGAPTGYWLSQILRGEIAERCTIRATPSIKMARIYAQRAPEVITNTFNSMWNFKHGFEDLSETKTKTYWSFMRSIGVPKLVVINPDHPAIGGRCKHEHDVHLTFVPPEAILDIEEIGEGPLR